MRCVPLVVTIFASVGCTSVPHDGATKFSHLRVHGQTVQVLNASQLNVTTDPSFHITGPHSFAKTEDTGYQFEVSLASFVAPHSVVTVTAERLIGTTKALNYTELPAASWPERDFLTRASGCAAITPEQAAAMSTQSGMQWILSEGFIAQGEFAFEASLLVAPDGQHEATIELIAPVASCEDAAAIRTALSELRARVLVRRGK